jgi:uncharacterized membrane protein
MRPRWVVIGLIASVALNLFLIGAGAGLFALSLRLAKANPDARPGALFWATQALPQPDRRQFRLMLKGVHDEVKADSARSLALRAAAWGALAAPKPDPATIKQQLTQSRQIDVAVRTTVEEKIVDYAAGLSPADRATFAAGMRRKLTLPAGPQPAATNAASTTAKP